MTQPPRLLATLGSLVLLTTVMSAGSTTAHADPAGAPEFGPRVYRLANLDGADTDSVVEEAAAAGSRLVFGATTPATGSEFFVTDGTRGGTRLLKDVRPGPDDGSDERPIVSFKGRVWFAATDGVNGTELWVSDGTRAGTRMFTDLNPGLPASNPNNLTVIGGRLWFSANNGASGSELFVSNGTVGGTRLVEDANPGIGGTSPQFFTPLGSRVVYSASIATAGGRELWVSDGTSAGTDVLKDVNSGPSSSFPTSLTTVGSRVIFNAQTPAGPAPGVEMWATDGTEAGTVPLRDIRPGTDGSFPGAPAVLPDGTAVFSALDGVSGIELWATDGTPSGTQLLYDLVPGAGSHTPFNLTRFGDAVYFRAGSGGAELWRTRGTAGSTDRVLGVPGSEPLVRGALIVVAGRLLFEGDDGGGDTQYYLSNGTAAGTRVVSDFTNLGDFMQLGVVGNTAVFGAEDQTGGLEPHAFVAATTATTGVPRARYAAATDRNRRLTVTVRVRTSSGVPAAGRVAIVRGATTFGTATVTNGVARVRLTRRLGPGVHTLRARFAGHVTGRASTSRPFRVRVLAPPRR